jgi:hypothetical protein
MRQGNGFTRRNREKPARWQTQLSSPSSGQPQRSFGIACTPPGY